MRIYKKRHWVHFDSRRPVLSTICVQSEQINGTAGIEMLRFNEHKLDFNKRHLGGHAKIEQGYLSNIEYEPPSRTEYQAWYHDQKSSGCVICGERDFCCLTYHHLSPPHKSGDITTLITACMPIVMILTEMSKCILLCRNCHAKAHCNRLSVSHIRPIDYMRLLETDPATQRLARRIKREPFKCEQCGILFLSLRKRAHCTSECRKIHARKKYRHQKRTGLFADLFDGLENLL